MHIRHSGLVDHIRTGCVNNDDASYLNNSDNLDNNTPAHHDNDEHRTTHHDFEQHNDHNDHIATRC